MVDDFAKTRPFVLLATGGARATPVRGSAHHSISSPCPCMPRLFTRQPCLVLMLLVSRVTAYVQHVFTHLHVFIVVVLWAKLDAAHSHRKLVFCVCVPFAETCAPRACVCCMHATRGAIKWTYCSRLTPCDLMVSAPPPAARRRLVPLVSSHRSHGMVALRLALAAPLSQKLSHLAIPPPPPPSHPPPPPPTVGLPYRGASASCLAWGLRVLVSMVLATEQGEEQARGKGWVREQGKRERRHHTMRAALTVVAMMETEEEEPPLRMRNRQPVNGARRGT